MQNYLIYCQLVTISPYNLKINEQKDRFSLKQLLTSPETVIRAAILFICMFNASLLGLPFFGDHVTLISIPASDYYNSGFQSIWLPDGHATGHPPFYALLTALSWTVFGKSLLISHLLTLIFSLVLIAQYARLTKQMAEPRMRSLALILLLANPVFLAQMAAMSIDVFLTAVFLWGINVIHSRKKILLIIACILLTMSSLRGFMLVVILFLYDWVYHKYTFKQLTINVLYYIIACIPVSLYFIFQYRHSGWWLVPTDGNWSEGRQFSDKTNILPKLFEFGLRFVEFGMLIPMVVFIYYLLKNYQTNRFNHKFVLILIGISVFAVFIIPFQNSVLIRYLLPLQLLVLLLYSEMVMHFKHVFLRKIAIGLTLVMMIGQHFVVYPETKSSAWAYNWGDGSLAHLSYFTFRTACHDYVVANKIPDDSIYAGFPDYKPFKYTDLTNDTIAYKNSDLACSKYIILSNVMNNIPYWQKEQIRTHAKEVKRWSRYPVEYVLYENTNLHNKYNDEVCK